MDLQHPLDLINATCSVVVTKARGSPFSFAFMSYVLALLISLYRDNQSNDSEWISSEYNWWPMNQKTLNIKKKNVLVLFPAKLLYISMQALGSLYLRGPVSYSHTVAPTAASDTALAACFKLNTWMPNSPRAVTLPMVQILSIHLP